MKNDIKILKFLINFSFFEKDNIITEIIGRISKKINIDLLNIEILIKKGRKMGFEPITLRPTI